MQQEILEAGTDAAGTVETVETLRARLGELLGTDTPVPERVLRVAVAYPPYARHLLGARGFPQALALLLANPPEVPEQAVGADEPAPPLGNRELVAGAAAAFARWAGSGFKRVTDEVRERRLRACAECEHLSAPRRTVLYRLTMARESAVCGRCGCPVARKASLATESCPAPHPTLPGLNRWEEARA